MRRRRTNRRANLVQKLISPGMLQKLSKTLQFLHIVSGKSIHHRYYKPPATTPWPAIQSSDPQCLSRESRVFPLLELPLDVLLLVFDELAESTLQHFLPLAVANRQLSEISLDYLYRRVCTPATLEDAHILALVIPPERLHRALSGSRRCYTSKMAITTCPGLHPNCKLHFYRYQRWRSRHHLYTLLEWAAVQGHSLTLLRLLQFPWFKENINTGGVCLALYLAVEFGNLSAVSILLDHGADINAGAGTGTTVLHKAVALGNAEMVELLVTRGADMTAILDEEYQPLHLAAVKGKVEVVKVLLRHGADIGARIGIRGGDVPYSIDAYSPYHPMAGDTALHLAVRTSWPDVVTMLLDRGANIEELVYCFRARAKVYWATPLYTAIASGLPDMVKLLLQRGASIATPSCGRITVLERVRMNEQNTHSLTYATVLRLWKLYGKRESINSEALSESDFGPLEDWALYQEEAKEEREDEFFRAQMHLARYASA